MLLAILGAVLVGAGPIVDRVILRLEQTDPRLGPLMLRPAIGGVVTSHGRPVEGVRVFFGRDHEGVDSCQQLGASASTDRQGRFYIPELRGGRSQLTAKESRYGLVGNELCVEFRGKLLPDVLILSDPTGHESLYFRCRFPAPPRDNYDSRVCT